MRSTYRKCAYLSCESLDFLHRPLRNGPTIRVMKSPTAPALPVVDRTCQKSPSHLEQHVQHRLETGRFGEIDLPHFARAPAELSCAMLILLKDIWDLSNLRLRNKDGALFPSNSGDAYPVVR